MVASPSPSLFFGCELLVLESQRGLFLRRAISIVAFATAAVEDEGATNALTDAVWTAA